MTDESEGTRFCAVVTGIPVNGSTGEALAIRPEKVGFRLDKEQASGLGRAIGIYLDALDVCGGDTQLESLKASVELTRERHGIPGNGWYWMVTKEGACWVPSELNPQGTK